MAKRKLPERYKSGPKRGQFKPRAARRSSTKRSTPKRRSSSRRTYRRNPTRPDVVKMVTNGSVTAVQVITGKAATRAVPDLLNLPRTGNAGLAIQVATALALGYVSDMFFSKTTSAAILAGGLTAPIETLIRAADVPYLSEYLGPDAGVSGYVQPRRPLGVSGYVQKSQAAVTPELWTDPEYSYTQYN